MGQTFPHFVAAAMSSALELITLGLNDVPA